MPASARQGLVEVLASLAIFEGISQANLSRIATQMRHRRFSKGTTIYRQGDPAREFFVLTAGRIAITVEGGDPEVPPVAVIDAPYWFGELAVLTEPTAEGFAGGMLALLRDPRRGAEIGARARQLAETKYSYEAYLGRTRQACEWLLGRPAEPQVAAGGVA